MSERMSQPRAMSEREKYTREVAAHAEELRQVCADMNVVDSLFICFFGSALALMMMTSIFRPVWPSSGLWATSQRGETLKIRNHTQPFINRGFLAIHFVN
jgi:hypothetical protein